MTDLISRLIADFFKNEKSVDYVIKPPTKTIRMKINYISDELLSVFRTVFSDKNDIDVFSTEIETIKNHGLIYRSSTSKLKGDFLDKSDRGMYTIEMIASEMSLRETLVVIEEFKKQLKLFRDSISWVDLLALSYIKIRHPELMMFFESTIDIFDVGSMMNREFFDGIDKYSQQRDKIKEFDTFISTYIPDVKPELKTIYKKLINLVAHCYIDTFINDTNHNDGVYLKEQSTSNNENLKKYLCEVLKIEEGNTEVFDLYRDLSKDINLLGKVKSLEIYKLSQFTRNTTSLDVDKYFYINVAEEILKRFENGNLPFSGFDYSGDSLRLHLVYEFCYLILWSLENSNKDTKLVSKSKDYILRFLRSNQPSYSLKFIVIDAFVNHEKEGRGEVDFRFERIWRDILMGDNDLSLVKAIKSVFNKLRQDYFIGQQKILYENEEHYTYVLYQSWSGKVNEDEINDIRKLAIRGLDKHIDVIEKYWSYYPSVDELTSGDIYVNIKYTQKNTQNLYMPIKNLIDVSLKVRGLSKKTRKKVEEWNKNFNLIYKDDKYKNMFELKEKSDTLESRLVRKGIL